MSFVKKKKKVNLQNLVIELIPLDMDIKAKKVFQDEKNSTKI